MKRSLLLAAGLVLTGALTARAELLGTLYFDQNGPLTLTGTGTSYDNHLDKVAIEIRGLTGGTYVNLIEGIWTATGGGIFLFGNENDGDDPWTNYPVASTTNLASFAAPQTTIHETSAFANMSNGNPMYRGALVTDYTGVYDDGAGGTGVTAGSYAAFGGCFVNSAINTAQMPKNGGTAAQKWIATLYVDKSVSSIRFGDEPAGPIAPTGYPSSIIIQGDVNVRPEHFMTGDPEPSTFVLLISGLIGMLGYAWRCHRA